MIVLRFFWCFIYLTLPLQVGLLACGIMIVREKLLRASE
jgi:hypothetical protein